jgi:hypothetical protein
MERHLTIIGRGAAGWHGAGITNHGDFSITGADIEDRTWNGTPRPGLLSEAPDGTYIYDLDGCAYGDVVDFAFKGPMCRPGAPDTDACPTTFRPLDYVSERDICRYAASIPGAKVGRIHNHEIIWN